MAGGILFVAISQRKEGGEMTPAVQITAIICLTLIILCWNGKKK